MVSNAEMISITCQCQLMDLSGSTYHYVPEPFIEEVVVLIRLIDQCKLELPFYGSRRVKDWLHDN